MRKTKWFVLCGSLKYLLTYDDDSQCIVKLTLAQNEVVRFARVIEMSYIYPMMMVSVKLN